MSVSHCLKWKPFNDTYAQKCLEDRSAGSLGSILLVLHFCTFFIAWRVKARGGNGGGVPRGVHLMSILPLTM